MKLYLSSLVIVCWMGCSTSSRNVLPERQSATPAIGGEAFYNSVMAAGWKQRDSLALKQILDGNIPRFLKKFVPVTSVIKDSSGRVYKAVFYVSPDYLSIGTENDFARIPMAPGTAQEIADSFQCFLPTKKMVDLIYEQARIKLAPVPMYAFRDSTITMWQHHLFIEGQRKNREGLVAGIKKDVVISTLMCNPSKAGKVAIYGWHLPGGKPIQPLYTGHVNWYTDYSHGIRLVSRRIKINGKIMDYKDVLMHPLYHELLSDEGPGFFTYPY